MLPCDRLVNLTSGYCGTMEPDLAVVKLALEL